MTATTPTTITGVSILTRQRRRKADLFDVALSHDGIEIRRPGQAAQHMPWNRVSQWEIEERLGDVVLTLRGDGAVTPLLIRGWTLDDLEILLRDVTAGTGGAGADGAAPPVLAEPDSSVPEHVAAPEAAAVAAPRPAPRAERRKGPQRARRQARPGWKAVATVALLCFLVAAVTVVLLQSAGIISWGFLGPTA